MGNRFEPWQSTDDGAFLSIWVSNATPRETTMIYARDPVVGLGILLMCGVFGVLVWWATLAAPDRLARLTAIAHIELARSAPPAPLTDQGTWLLHHRLEVLSRCALIALGAVCLGLVEGLDQRRRMLLRGMAYVPFLLGKTGVLLTLALMLGYGVVPWPQPLGRLALTTALCLGTTSYFVTIGFPRLR